LEKPASRRPGLVINVLRQCPGGVFFFGGAVRWSAPRRKQSAEWFCAWPEKLRSRRWRRSRRGGPAGWGLGKPASEMGRVFPGRGPTPPDPPELRFPDHRRLGGKPHERVDCAPVSQPSHSARLPFVVFSATSGPCLRVAMSGRPGAALGTVLAIRSSRRRSPIRDVRVAFVALPRARSSSVPAAFPSSLRREQGKDDIPHAGITKNLSSRAQRESTAPGGLFRTSPVRSCANTRLQAGNWCRPRGGVRKPGSARWPQHAVFRSSNAIQEGGGERERQIAARSYTGSQDARFWGNFLSQRSPVGL